MPSPMLQAANSEAGRKILAFASLPVGWHYGTGVPPSPKAVRVALAYLAFLSALGFAENDAFPGADGEIMVTVYLDNSYIQVSLEADESIDINYKIGMADEEYIENMSSVEALLRLPDIANQIKREAWNTSGSFIQTHMTAGSANLLITPSKGHLMEAESLYSRQPVSSMAEVPSANIPDNTIQGFPENHPFFGSLMNPYYKQAGR